MLWLFALAVGYALEHEYRIQAEAFKQASVEDFRREVGLLGQLWKAAYMNKQAEERFLLIQNSRVSEYVLLDANNSVLRASRQELAGVAAERYFGPEVLPLLAKARLGEEVTVSLAGDRLMGFYPVRGNASGERRDVFVVQAGIPRLSSLTQAHHRGLGYLAAMVLIVTAIFGLFIHFVVNRRLVLIGRAIARFAEGDANARSGLTGGDAITCLGRRFDEMAERMGVERRNLAESEERLKFALHGSNTGIWDWNIASGHTYYSPRWKSLLGFAEDELHAHAEEWLKRVHPDDLPQVMERLKAHMSGENVFFESEHRLRNKDNRYIWVLERGMAVRDDKGTACRMVGALVDISRRKEMEFALQRSEEEYRSVVDAVTQVIFRSDAKGRFTFLNPAWHELTGFPVEAGLSHLLADFVDVEDRIKIWRLFDSVKERGSEVVECEFRLVTSDGRPRWFVLQAHSVCDVHGETGMVGVLVDIDGQKNAQFALTQSINERNSILNLSPDGYVLTNRSQRVVYVNPAFLSMTSLVVEQVVGECLDALENRIRGLCDLHKPLPVFAATPGDRENILYLDKPAKAVLKCLARGLRDESGNVQGGVMFFRDVTRETEVDRMKSEFLSTAAHELRTPMASIFGFAELLLAREFDAATQRDLIQTIHRQTRNLIDLVNELLDLARIEARGGKSFNILEQELTPIVLNAVSSLYLPEETHRMEVALPESLPRVSVDAEKLHQSLANVLSNAFKYSPGGGVIRVFAASRNVRGREFVGVVVQDQGIGMTSEQMARIFDRFYRAEASGAIPGSGLGMSLVKEIMEIFGGEVGVSSVVGQGTEVTLWLPAVGAGKVFS